MRGALDSMGRPLASRARCRRCAGTAEKSYDEMLFPEIHRAPRQDCVKCPTAPSDWESGRPAPPLVLGKMSPRRKTAPGFGEKCPGSWSHPEDFENKDFAKCLISPACVGRRPSPARRETLRSLSYLRSIDIPPARLKSSPIDCCRRGMNRKLA